MILTLTSGQSPGAASSAGKHCLPPVIVTNDYTGVLFETPPFKPAGYDADGTWSPTRAEVSTFEASIRKLLRRMRNLQKFTPEACDWKYNTPETCRRAVKRDRDSLATILVNLRLYRRQYAGISIGSKRILVVNAFMGPTTHTSDYHPEWLSEWVVVHGGGANYWQVQFDIAGRSFHQFYVNAER
jgi:hypothetical protein